MCDYHLHNMVFPYSKLLKIIYKNTSTCMCTSFPYFLVFLERFLEPHINEKFTRQKKLPRDNKSFHLHSPSSTNLTPKSSFCKNCRFLTLQVIAQQTCNVLSFHYQFRSTSPLSAYTLKLYRTWPYLLGTPSTCHLNK